MFYYITTFLGGGMVYETGAHSVLFCFRVFHLATN